MKGVSRMNDVMIIANPSSGQKQSEEYAGYVQDYYKKKNKSVTLNFTEKLEDIGAYAKKASEDHYKTIIVLGGDGTISELANSLKDNDYRPEIGIIPTGTANNIANGLNIPSNLNRAVESLDYSHPQKTDAGLINDRIFMSSVSAGTITESAWQVTKEQKESYGAAAYFIEGLKSLRNEDSYRFKLIIDGKTIEADLNVLLVGVSDSIIGIDGFFDSARYNDGKLHLFGLKSSTLSEKLTILPSIFRNENEFNKNQDLAFTMPFEEAEIHLKEKVAHLAMDGEKGPDFPVNIKVLPGYFTFLVPEEKTGLFS